MLVAMEGEAVCFWKNYSSVGFPDLEMRTSLISDSLDWWESRGCK